MVYQIITQTPESPIAESWNWVTDVNTSFDGSEDRTPILRYPRRTFSGSFAFDTVQDVRRHLAMMTKRFKTEFRFPLFQYQTKLKAPVAAGTDTLVVNSRRSDFRVGGNAFVFEGSKYEEVVVASFDAVSVKFTTNLVNSYTQRAYVCPVVNVLTNTNASVTRKAVDHYATSSFSFDERLPTLPFVSPLNAVVIDTFDGLPLIPYVPYGSEFDNIVSTGIQVISYDNVDDFISPWKYASWAHNVSFKASRLGLSQDFEWWQAFADLIQGSANPFLLPTNRDDLGVVTPVAGGGQAVTVNSDVYTQHYWGNDAYSRIFIDSDAGRHYAKVTAISAVGGNDRLTFSPAVPNGDGWTSNQKVGFVLKLRNDNDLIKCNHYGLWTEIEMAVRTVS